MWSQSKVQKYIIDQIQEVKVIIVIIIIIWSLLGPLFIVDYLKFLGQ